MFEVHYWKPKLILSVPISHSRRIVWGRPCNIKYIFCFSSSIGIFSKSRYKNVNTCWILHTWNREKLWLSHETPSITGDPALPKVASRVTITTQVSCLWTSYKWNYRLDTSLCLALFTHRDSITLLTSLNSLFSLTGFSESILPQVIYLLLTHILILLKWCVAVVQVSGMPSLALSGASARSWIQSEPAGAWANTRMECQCSKWQFNLLLNKAGPYTYAL